MSNLSGVSAISFPEPSLPLSSGTGKRSLRFPVPLDKGNEGSGNEIGVSGTQQNVLIMPWNNNN